MSVKAGFSPHQLPVSADARFLVSFCQPAKNNMPFCFWKWETCYVAAFYSDGQNTHYLHFPDIVGRLPGLACDKPKAK